MTKKTRKQRQAANADKKSVNTKGLAAKNVKKEGSDNEAECDDVSKEEVKKEVRLVNGDSHKTSHLNSPKGLTNLGNTCFFNSVMQNLCRSPGLIQALQYTAAQSKIAIRRDDVEPLDIDLPPPPKLVEALLNFLITMNRDSPQDDINTIPGRNRRKPRTRVESPRVLFNQICAIAPRFRGYQQQDSQELLRTLLDGIKTEEIKRRKQAILFKLGLLGKRAKDVDPTLKERVKIYGQIATKIPTVVDIVFSGTLVSSVLCDDCGQITQVTEEFLDISLPIVDIAPTYHHTSVGKKYQKTQTEGTSVDASSPAPLSKHAMKQQRKQAKKGRGRKGRDQKIDPPVEEMESLTLDATGGGDSVPDLQAGGDCPHTLKNSASSPDNPSHMEYKAENCDDAAHTDNSVDPDNTRIIPHAMWKMATSLAQDSIRAALNFLSGTSHCSSPERLDIKSENCSRNSVVNGGAPNSDSENRGQDTEPNESNQSGTTDTFENAVTRMPSTDAAEVRGSATTESRGTAFTQNGRVHSEVREYCNSVVDNDTDISSEILHGSANETSPPATVSNNDIAKKNVNVAGETVTGSKKQAAKSHGTAAENSDTDLNLHQNCNSVTEITDDNVTNIHSSNKILENCKHVTQISDKCNGTTMPNFMAEPCGTGTTPIVQFKAMQSCGNASETTNELRALIPTEENQYARLGMQLHGISAFHSTEETLCSDDNFMQPTSTMQNGGFIPNVASDGASETAKTNEIAPSIKSSDGVPSVMDAETVQADSRHKSQLGLRPQSCGLVQNDLKSQGGPTAGTQQSYRMQDDPNGPDDHESDGNDGVLNGNGQPMDQAMVHHSGAADESDASAFENHVASTNNQPVQVTGFVKTQNGGSVINGAGVSDEPRSPEARRSSVSEHTEPSSGNDEQEASGNGHDDGKRNGPSLFETPAKQDQRFRSFCNKLPTCLTQRYEPAHQECSIQSCLHKFTMAEMLTGNNKFGCDECTKRQAGGEEKPKTVYCDASKQMLIKTPPLLLTLHLKRFQQSGRSLRKFSKNVSIPVELDLSPFCSTEAENYADENKMIRYRVFGLVEHCGSLSRGHYTSYVNVRPENSKILDHLNSHFEKNDKSESLEKGGSDESDDEGIWYHISDASVAKCTQDQALRCNAYLVFYERMF